MATLKLGEGIQLEAQLPTKLDLASKEEKAYETTQRTTELNTKLKELEVSLKNEMGILEEKVNGNEESIVDLLNCYNKLEMKESQIFEQVINPEIKSVTIHRNHTKDFEDVYQKMHLDNVQMNAVINEKNEDLEILKKQNNNQFRVNLCLCFAAICSLILHLF